MAISIPSVNIRRFYTKEENDLANDIRDIENKLEDIKNFKKIQILAKNNIYYNKYNYNLMNIVDRERIKLEENKTWNGIDVGVTMKDFTFYKNDIEIIEGYNILSKEQFCSIFYYNVVLREDKDNKEKITSIVTLRDKQNVSHIKKFIKENSDLICKKSYNKDCREDSEMSELRSKLKNKKDSLDMTIKNFNKINKTKLRSIKSFFQADYVDLFQCELSDSFNIENYNKNNDIIIVNVNQDDMFLQMVINGFTYENEKYQLFSASAGQLRKVKVMFVKSKKYQEAKGRLTNDLSIEDINKNDGINITKWSAYLALSTSATTIWNNFNIDKVLVIDDFETILKDREVDHINSEFKIERIKKDVVIPHTDGFGMVNSRKYHDTRVIRAPWIKGLVAPFDYITFIEENKDKVIGDKCIYKINNIYGVECDIREYDIILTKSQFKMHGYYKSWDDYVEKFKKNKCSFRYMHSEKKKDLRMKAKFNYQMWNTLDVEDMTEFVEYFIADEKETIVKAHSQAKEMLELFFVDTKNYNNNSNMQKALCLYPAMIKTNVFRAPLGNMITKRKKDLKQGRIKINGVYTFLIPDIYAWCESMFLREEVPNGLLKDGEVYCRLIKDEKEILVNRSPHLYLEHCVRFNKINKEIKKWFKTSGVYTSSHDMISKQLFFDNDGDIALVVDNDRLVSEAKKTMVNNNIVPLDFELAKAGKVKINPKNIVKAYTSAFGVNIGEFSNMITKVMNSDNRDISLVAKICWLNNVFIDYAKTSWAPKVPKKLQETIKELKKRKLPHFFIYAKDKEPDSVLPINKNSVVDNMVKAVDEMFFDKELGIRKNIKYDFSKFERFKLDKLTNKKVNEIKYNIEDEEMENTLLWKFNDMCKSKHRTMMKRRYRELSSKDDLNESEFVDESLKMFMYEFLKENDINIIEASDILIKYVFRENKNKDMLFILFGDIIVKNLESEFSELIEDKEIRCEVCGNIVKKASNRAKYCKKCYDMVQKTDAKNRMKRLRGDVVTF